MQRKTEEAALKADAIFMAIPCETTTRAREKPIPGHRNPPFPLRSHAEVRGIASLKPADRAKGDMGNRLIDFSLGLANRVARSQRSIAVGAESPRGCWLWDFRGAKDLLVNGFEDADYMACAYFAARAKKQRIRHNFPEMNMVLLPPP